MMRHAIKTVIRVETLEMFDRYAPDLLRVMRMFGDRWGERPGQHVSVSLQNLRMSLPYLWLALTEEGGFAGAATLTDIVPGRHVYIHGVIDPGQRKHLAIDATIREVMRFAFEELHVLKVKAECLPAHWGARGFCRRFGFLRAATLPDDRMTQEGLSDVLLYALTKPQWLKNIQTGGINYVDGQ